MIDIEFKFSETDSFKCSFDPKDIDLYTKTMIAAEQYEVADYELCCKQILYYTAMFSFRYDSPFVKLNNLNFNNTHLLKVDWYDAKKNLSALDKFSDQFKNTFIEFTKSLLNYLSNNKTIYNKHVTSIHEGCLFYTLLVQSIIDSNKTLDDDSLWLNRIIKSILSYSSYSYYELFENTPIGLTYEDCTKTDLIKLIMSNLFSSGYSYKSKVIDFKLIDIDVIVQITDLDKDTWIYTSNNVDIISIVYNRYIAGEIKISSLMKICINAIKDYFTMFPTPDIFIRKFEIKDAQVQLLLNHYFLAACPNSWKEDKAAEFRKNNPQIYLYNYIPVYDADTNMIYEHFNEYSKELLYFITGPDLIKFINQLNENTDLEIRRNLIKLVVLNQIELNEEQFYKLIEFNKFNNSNINIDVAQRPILREPYSKLSDNQTNENTSLFKRKEEKYNYMKAYFKYNYDFISSYKYLPVSWISSHFYKLNFLVMLLFQSKEKIAEIQNLPNYTKAKRLKAFESRFANYLNMKSKCAQGPLNFGPICDYCVNTGHKLLDNESCSSKNYRFKWTKGTTQDWD